MEWLLLLLFVAFIAYGLGVQIEKERQQSRNYRAAEERERERVAALSPEDRLAEERKRLRDQVIHNLKPEDKVFFSVYQPNDPKTIALEKMVDRVVDEMLTRRG